VAVDRQDVNRVGADRYGHVHRSVGGPVKILQVRHGDLVQARDDRGQQADLPQAQADGIPPGSRTLDRAVLGQFA